MKKKVLSSLVNNLKKEPELYREILTDYFNRNRIPVDAFYWLMSCPASSQVNISAIASLTLSPHIQTPRNLGELSTSDTPIGTMVTVNDKDYQYAGVNPANGLICLIPIGGRYTEYRKHDEPVRIIF